jgi:hypothetical protein
VSAARQEMYNWQLYSLTTGILVDKGQIASTGGVLDFSRQSAGIYLLQIDMHLEKPATQTIVLK